MRDIDAGAENVAVEVLAAVVVVNGERMGTVVYGDDVRTAVERGLRAAERDA